MSEGPVVKVFSAGDHYHNEPGIASEIISQLLNRSGYTKYDWECRIDKKMHCAPESRPIRVIGHKPYGVVLRVKPKPNATFDQQMTLYIPEGSGYSASNLFEQLKNCEKSISRVVRQQEKEKKTVMTTNSVPVPVPPTALPVVEQEPVEELIPAFPNLRQLAKKPEKLKFVLEKIKEIEESQFCHNRVQFVEILRHKCKWEKSVHRDNAIGRVLSELVKNEYIMEIYGENDKIKYYALTPKGKYYLDFKLVTKTKTEPEVKKEEKEVFDISTTLVAIKEKLQELANVAAMIVSNNSRIKDLEAEISKLHDQNRELAKVLDQNKEANEVLVKLGQMVRPLPLNGVKNAS